MKSAIALLTTVFMSLTSLDHCRARELNVAMKANGKALGVVVVKYEGDSATVTDGDKVVEEFDLKEMKWRVEDKDVWITLDQCKKFAELSKEKSAKSAPNSPEAFRPFLTWMLDPTFTTESKDDVFRLTSGQVDYVLEGRISATEAERDQYFRYMELNAYKKAMTERKLPPFAELKSIEAMKGLGYIPRKISIKIPGIPGAPHVEIELTERKP